MEGAHEHGRKEILRRARARYFIAGNHVVMKGEQAFQVRLLSDPARRD